MTGCQVCGRPNPLVQIVCDTCWDRPPTNLPDAPRWRSRRRSLIRFTRKGDEVWRELENIDRAVLAWLRDHAESPEMVAAQESLRRAEGPEQ